MTREEARNKLITDHCFVPGKCICIAKGAGTCSDCEINTATKALEQEPKTGHWIYDDKCHEHGHCSKCGYGRVDLVDGEPHNFCRRCGAKMVEREV